MGRAVKAGQEDLMNKVVVLSGEINELHCNLKNEFLKAAIIKSHHFAKYFRIYKILD